MTFLTGMLRIVVFLGGDQKCLDKLFDRVTPSLCNDNDIRIGEEVF
jgi:hypothetical protein